jgi:hypothetical protein
LATDVSRLDPHECFVCFHERREEFALLSREVQKGGFEGRFRREVYG